MLTRSGSGDALPFTYNLTFGGRRWFDSLGRVRDIFPAGAGTTTQYGVDVVVIGDSTGTYSTIYESWPHLLKVLLQEQLNRPGVTGGFGFFPFQTQNSIQPPTAAANDWNVQNVYTFTVSAASAIVGAVYQTGLGPISFSVVSTIAGATTLVATANTASGVLASGTLTKVSGTGDATITYSSFVTTSAWIQSFHDGAGNPGVGNYQARINPASNNNKIWRYFDPTVAGGVFQRQGITDWEYVGLLFNGVATTVFCDNAQSNGALAPTNKLTASNSGLWGNHWARQFGLTASVGNTIQVASDSGSQTWANGAILYNGDYNEGLRLHNQSSVGSASDSWVANDGTSSSMLDMCVGQFATGANGGARNCKLVLVNTMLNDCGITSQYMSAAQFQTNLQTIVTRCLAYPSLPCVGIIINQPWDSTFSNPTQLANYLAYRGAAYSMVQANDHVFIIDFWKILTDSLNTQYAPHGSSLSGAIFQRGWYNDGTHLLSTGNFARAQMLFKALTFRG